MKGKALRKHSLHEKTAASVLLKLFISGKIRYKITYQSGFTGFSKNENSLPKKGKLLNKRTLFLFYVQRISSQCIVPQFFILLPFL